MSTNLSATHYQESNKKKIQKSSGEISKSL